MRLLRKPVPNNIQGAACERTSQVPAAIVGDRRIEDSGRSLGSFILSPSARTRDDVRPLRRLIVTRALRPASGILSHGRLIAGPLVIRCALGTSGIAHRKREGDGATPAGRFRLLSGFFRSDRMARPPSTLPLVALRTDHGWCDDPSSPPYNRLISLPCRQSHERLWRKDDLYNIIIILHYNMKPRSKGRGSAIFFHLADEKPAATAGCVAISRADMRRLLPRLGRGTVMIIR